VTGGDKMPNTILHYDRVSQSLSWRFIRGQGKDCFRARTPFGQVARMESEAVNTPAIRTEIRLFDNERRSSWLRMWTRR